jgi:Rrf2 family nitric oxide-sensitive transcriptional repressor
MRLTTRTNLALRTLMFCAVNKDSLVRKQDAAQAVNASENHLAQVINKLGQEGFIITQRGRHGGFHLARAASSISVGEVFRAFESGLPFMECFSPNNTCPLKAHCVMRAHLSRAVEAFYSALDEVYLSELVECNAGLQAILNMEAPRFAAACTTQAAADAMPDSPARLVAAAG